MAKNEENQVETAEQQLEGYPVERVDLRNVVSNIGQTRLMGVLPVLAELGYGLFERSSLAEAEPVWGMLLSDDEATRQQAANLVAQHEEEILLLWRSVKTHGQQQAAGVWYYDDGTCNVVWGMRRAIACALGYALGEGPPSFDARTLPAGFSQLEYETLGQVENNDRQSEGPIDKALTYQRWIKEEKLNKKQVAERIDRSVQSVENHLALLHKDLTPYRVAINKGDRSIDWALKHLASLKPGGRNPVEQGDANGKQRPRLPNAKSVVRILEGFRPPKMGEKEWGYWTDEKVREFMCFMFNKKYKPLTPKQLEDANKKAESNGKMTSKDGKYPVGVGRKAADRLLVALGKTDAASWSDKKAKEALENIVNIAEPDFLIEEGGPGGKNEKLQKLLTALLENHSKGLNVTFTKAPAKAGAK